MSAKTTGFFEAKRRVVSAIDYRLDSLKQAFEVLGKQQNYVDHFGYENRIDELEALRSFVKGMVVKADEQSPRKN